MAIQYFAIWETGPAAEWSFIPPHGSGLLAVITRTKGYVEDGVHFISSPDLSQQLGFLKHPTGKRIVPHIHNHVPRFVNYTEEVLIVLSGKLWVDFYNQEQIYLCSRNLYAGDVLLLLRGGHGFEVLEDCEIWEIKNGPYVGEHDKTRFIPRKRVENAAETNEPIPAEKSS